MTTDERIFRDLAADEHTTLTGFLDYYRRAVRRKCDGLSPEQLARRAVTPSTMSLLGLVRHLADVEREWFRNTMGGAQAPPLYRLPDAPDGDFDAAEPDPGTVARAWADWESEVAAAETLVADAPDLGVPGTHHYLGPVSLRWVLVHMIEEYARHAGHADLLRQAIDGEVGH